MTRTHTDPWHGLELRKFYLVKSTTGPALVRMWVVDGWAWGAEIEPYTAFTPVRRDGALIEVNDEGAELWRMDE